MKKPIGTSMLFVNDKNEVMIFLRDDIPSICYPGCWDIIGGQAEGNETAAEAIIREVKEEVELEIVKPKLFRVSDFDDRTEYTFWMKTNLGIKDINLQEGQRLKWFTKDEFGSLPEEKVAFNFKPVILDFFKEKPFEK